MPAMYKFISTPSFHGSYELAMSYNEGFGVPDRAARGDNLIREATTDTKTHASIWKTELTNVAAPGLELDEDMMFPFEDANPCSTCQKLTLEMLAPSYIPREIFRSGCMHHTSWTTLNWSASKGCKLCALIRDALLKSVRGDERYLDKYGVNCSVHIRPESFKKQAVYGLIGVDLSTNHSSTALNKTAAKSDIGLYTDIGDVAANLLPGRRLSKIPSLARILFEIQRWIACRGIDKKPPVDLPRRVIDVTSSSDPMQVVLREIDSNADLRRGRYVCLSHRWGQSTKPMNTTKATLPFRREGIWLRDLPRTFRDAIKITRRLGVQYIWIDSLCIVQDSDDDWEEESSKMGQYYSSSWLTIGAGMDEDGLFVQRTSPATPYCRLKVPSGDPHNPISNIYFSQEPYTMPGRSIDGSNLSLLYSRGWTLQEEMLSPRFLSFEPTQVYFRCSKYVDFECGCRALTSKWNCLGSHHLSSKDLWPRVVEDFSNRTLTVISDKLPALSGLAQVYRNSFGDTYLAGLWKNEIWKHLSWYAKKAKRPLQYLGPSWSWVSVDSPVVFAGSRFTDSCIVLVDASTRPIGKNLLGRLENGKIIIRAPAARMSIQVISEPDTAEQKAILCTAGGQEYNFIADEPLHSDLQDATFVFITNTLGLGLVPAVDEESTFRRIGLAFVSKSDNIEMAESTISII